MGIRDGILVRRIALASFVALGLMPGAWVSAGALEELSSKDASSGLRTALDQGIEKAVGRLGVQNGFLGNPKVEIPLPAGLDIDPSWLEGVRRIGLTAGASAPEVLVEQVSERLAQFGFTDQRDLDLIREDVRFTLPPELASIAPAPRR